MVGVFFTATILKSVFSDVNKSERSTLSGELESLLNKNYIEGSSLTAAPLQLPAVLIWAHVRERTV